MAALIFLNIIGILLTIVCVIPYLRAKRALERRMLQLNSIARMTKRRR